MTSIPSVRYGPDSPKQRRTCTRSPPHRERGEPYKADSIIHVIEYEVQEVDVKMMITGEELRCEFSINFQLNLT